nr:unnamed protein product [Digitaria exilis]
MSRVQIRRALSLGLHICAPPSLLLPPASRADHTASFPASSTSQLLPFSPSAAAVPAPPAGSIANAWNRWRNPQPNGARRRRRPWSNRGGAVAVDGRPPRRSRRRRWRALPRKRSRGFPAAVASIHRGRAQGGGYD